MKYRGHERKAVPVSYLVLLWNQHGILFTCWVGYYGEDTTVDQYKQTSLNILYFLTFTVSDSVVNTWGTLV